MAKDRSIQLNDAFVDDDLMDIKIDVKRDSQGKIVQGVAIGDTLKQNQAIILITQPGENKFNPDLGVGITDMLLGHDYLTLRHRIREHFAKDGLKVNRLDVYQNKPFVVDAEY